MKKITQIWSLFSLFFLMTCKESPALPVSEWNSNSTKPIVFYISGDGGFNTFSQTFSEELHKQGYDVFALNTKKYFWHKKTPQQAADDFQNYLQHIINDRKNKKIIIIGFSYGAEVAPFVYNRFDADFKKEIQDVIIIGPTAVNDFEIHLQEYITDPVPDGYSVIHEINQLKNVPFTLVVSDIEKKNFPRGKITLKNYRFLHLRGNHDFSGNTKMLADAVLKFL